MFRRDRYCPAEIIEARIYILEQNRQATLNLAEMSISSYFWVTYLVSITWVDFLKISLQLFLKILINFCNNGRQHSSKTGNN